ncbi:hypothetical protein EDD15DRAFT_2281148 [Pisolithus albus]|nr:hypothetical protein EDD15DRAFT_2281148 [Pisolithus albus]
MTTSKLFESVLQILFPRNDMLRVLQNNSLPQKVLPRTYALSAYNNAILCPLGMLYTHQRGVLRLCPSCMRALRSHPPRQPRDSLANFQYYGLSQLPHDIQEAISKGEAASFVSFCFRLFYYGLSPPSRT